MDIDEIRELIQQLIKLVTDLPEPYKAATYEILLNHLLISQEITAGKAAPSLQPEAKSPTPTFSVPIDVLAFFQQYAIDEEVIQKLFLVQGAEIRPIYKILTTVKAKAQIQVALLKALENALITKKFSFQQKDVREKLIELKLYDGTNFSSTFKSKNTLFKSLDGDEIELSGEGKSELAEVVLELAK